MIHVLHSFSSKIFEYVPKITANYFLRPLLLHLYVHPTKFQDTVCPKLQAQPCDLRMKGLWWEIVDSEQVETGPIFCTCIAYMSVSIPCEHCFLRFNWNYREVGIQAKEKILQCERKTHGSMEKKSSHHYTPLFFASTANLLWSVPQMLHLIMCCKLYLALKIFK